MNSELGSARSVVAVLFLALAGGAGYLAWQRFYEKDQVIAEQKRVIAELAKKLDRAWADELVADLRVDRVEDADAQGGPAKMHLTFVQYKPGSEEPLLDKRELVLLGEEVYIDALVVHFERDFVEQGDALRGKSLLLFRRAFGDRQKPVDGTPLYRSQGLSPIPETVQVDATPSNFEAQLWEKFWVLANDPKLAAAQGVRIAQGEAPHVKAVPGQVYQLRLRASGGLEIKPRLPAALLGTQATP